MEQRIISWQELAELQGYAEAKYYHLSEEEQEQAIFQFVADYINGGKLGVFNARKQFLADFDSLDDAKGFVVENCPVSELWSIEVV